MRFLRAIVATFDKQSSWVQGGIVGLVVGLTIGLLLLADAFGDSPAYTIFDVACLAAVGTTAGVVHMAVRGLKRTLVGRVLSWIITAAAGLSALAVAYDGFIQFGVESIAFLLGMSVVIGAALALLEWHWRR